MIKTDKTVKFSPKSVNPTPHCHFWRHYAWAVRGQLSSLKLAELYRSRCFMGHCSSDPELEVLLNPLSFSLVFGRYSPSPAYSLLFFYFEGLLVGCIVRVWRQRGLQGCLDTDWIHSFIIRQIGWSRCELCKSRSGSCSEPNPFSSHPTGKSTGEGRVF